MAAPLKFANGEVRSSTFYDIWNYLSMLGLKYIQIAKHINYNDTSLDFWSRYFAISQIIHPATDEYMTQISHVGNSVQFLP